MTVEDAMRSDNKSSPANGTAGQELPEWYDIGVLPVTSDKLTIVDFAVISDKDGVIVDVPAGDYRVQAKVMSFDGSLGISRARRCDPDVPIQSGPLIGNVSVDIGRITIGDTFGVRGQLVPSDRQTIRDVAKQSRKLYGNMVTFGLAARRLMVACVSSGFGDGNYPARALMHANQITGVEIEFVENGHVFTAIKFDKAAMLAKLDALRDRLRKGGPEDENI